MEGNICPCCGEEMEEIAVHDNLDHCLRIECLKDNGYSDYDIYSVYGSYFY